jgi:hypothetical protein
MPAAAKRWTSTWLAQYVLVINLKTLKALGLDALARADEVIE